MSLFLLIWFFCGHYWLFTIGYPPDFEQPLRSPDNWCDKTVVICALTSILLFYAIGLAFSLVLAFVVFMTRYSVIKRASARWRWQDESTWRHSVSKDTQFSLLFQGSRTDPCEISSKELECLSKIFRQMPWPRNPSSVRWASFLIDVQYLLLYFLPIKFSATLPFCTSCNQANDASTSDERRRIASSSIPMNLRSMVDEESEQRCWSLLSYVDFRSYDDDLSSIHVCFLCWTRIESRSIFHWSLLFIDESIVLNFYRYGSGMSATHFICWPLSIRFVSFNILGECEDQIPLLEIFSRMGIGLGKNSSSLW